MDIKILFLCYDFMNLYGENGNIRMLERRLAEQGANVTVDRLEKGVKPNFCEYDFIYCGSGTESKRNMALSYLMPYKDELREVIDAGKVVLFTGNAWEMLGKSIKLGSGEAVDGLGIFDYTVEENSRTRLVGDAVLVPSEGFAGYLSGHGVENKFVGFINKCSVVSGNTSPMFEVEMLSGDGNSPKDKVEGFVYKNFFGTGLTGPILVKNPHFLKMVLKKLLGEEYSEKKYETEEKAYEITLRELSNREN